MSPMKVTRCSLLIILLFSFSGKLISQDAAKILDKAYGLDQTLYNGKKYTFLAPPGTTGNQFLLSQLFSPGIVTVRGIRYANVSLNYDIFNQQLLLQYADEKSPLNILEVSKAWLQSFRMAGMNFELLSLQQEPQIYQVLGDGPVRILYFWRKNMSLNDIIGANNYVFTPTVRDSYVLINGQLKPYTSKRSLIKIFDSAKRGEIKNYLRKNKVRVKKASDKTMSEVINFIGNIK